MYRIFVSSSNINSIGYDAVSSILEIEFNTGAVYQYFDVPSQVHNQLMNSSSKGSFLNENIKYTYRYQRVK